MVHYFQASMVNTVCSKALGAFNALMKPLAQSTKALSRFKEKPLAQPPRAFSPINKSL